MHVVGMMIFLETILWISWLDSDPLAAKMNTKDLRLKGVPIAVRQRREREK
jgi:hypothetical protein